MNQDHERILELLAAYSLRSLSGEDAAQADQLLSEHVPYCPSCRDALAGFQALAGELALVPPSRTPPDLLLPRLHRELEQRAVGRRPRLVLVAAAAAIAAVMGMGALSVGLGIRASNVQAQNALVEQALRAANRSDATKVPLVDAAARTQAPMTEISAPGLQNVYLIGEDVPPPGPGMVYRVWLGSGGIYHDVGEIHVRPGITVVEITIDSGQFDEILITEEPAGPHGTSPAGTERWSASLLAA